MQPNRGVLSPNSSITMKITLNKGDRNQLEEIYNSLGQSAVDIDKAALLISSCNISSTDFDLDDIDELWTSIPCGKNAEIEIRHYMVSDEAFTGQGLGHWNNVPRNLPRPFSATAEVCSSLDDINKKYSRKGWEKCISFMCTTLGVGFSVFSSLGTSFFPLLLWLDSLLHLVLDQGEFVKELQKFDQDSVAIMGKVVKRHKRVDDIMDKEEYLVQVEYKATEEDGSVDTCVANYSSGVISHGAKELFQMTESSSLVHMKILPSCPSSVIPTFLFEKKLRVSQYWTTIMHPLRVVLGILFYFGLSLLGLIVFPAYIVLPCAIVGVFLMVPLSYLSVRNDLELKKRLVQSEPVSIPTKSDVHHDWVLRTSGRSQSRQLKLLVAVVGSCACMVMSPILCIVSFIFVHLSLERLSSPRRESVKSLKEGDVIPGKVSSRRTTGGPRAYERLYYGTIQYDLLRYGNRYTLEKEFLHRYLFLNVGKRVEVCIMPEHPRSGHPKEILQSMDFSEVNYLLLLIALFLYLLGHVGVYSSSDSGNEAIVLWIAFGLAPLLVVPQLLVWGEVQYQRSQEQLFNGAKVVGFQKMEVQHSRTEQRVPEAISVDAEDGQYIETPSSEVDSALIGNASSHTRIPELTDGESFVATYPVSNRIEHFVGDRV